MCLEGMLVNATSKVPGLKYFTPLILFIIYVSALFLSIMTGHVGRVLVACCCPVFYLIYHFATLNKENKSN